MNAMRLFFALTVVGAWGVAEAIEIVAPTEGETARQHFPAQVEYLTKPLAERERYFDGAENARAMVRDGSRPKPIQIRWKDAAGAVRVTVKRLPDGKVFFLETISATNGVAVNSLEIARSWELTVADGQSSASVRFRTEDLAPRLVRIAGVPNARDLGGWKGLGGRRVRQGVLFRTSGLNDNPPHRYLPGAEVMRLDAAGKLEKMGKDGGRLHVRIAHGEDFATNESVRVGFLDAKGADRLSERERRRVVEAFGFKVDLDLRRDEECARMTGSPLGEEVAWQHISYLPYDLDSEKAKEANRRAFRVLFDAECHPVAFHCIGGADRTGCLAFFIQALCDVDDDTLVKDWELTCCYTARSSFVHEKGIDRLFSMLAKYPGATTKERTKAFLRECGVTDADMDSVRSALLPAVLCFHCMRNYGKMNVFQ